MSFFSYSKLRYNNEQVKAVNDILKFVESSDDKYFGLYGYAGSGKTTLITEIIKYLISKSKINNVVFSAPTNKAVSVLESKVNLDSFEYKDNSSILFKTIHSLFNYSTDFTTEGVKVFIKKSRKKRKLVNIIVIDECSMIQKDIAQEIFNDVDGILRDTKIIFVGDPSQLPPVNEISSVIFTSKIITKYIILKEIVRNRYDDINNLWSSVRRWVSDNERLKGIKAGENIKVFRKTNVKTKSKWFYKFIKKIKKNEVPIILTWTNKQTNEYNNIIRKLIFNSEDKYVVNDILIFSDFYTNEEMTYYTSEQVRVVDVQKSEKKIKFISKLNDSLLGRIIKEIINRLKMSYKVWKLKVKRIDDTYDEAHTIYIIHEESESYLKNDTELAFKIIKRLYSEKKINNKHVKKLWEVFNNLLVDPFANVNYGFSITTHKSQGSTYTNVFIDVDDILDNKNENDAKRCLYTALTRSSNKVYLLV